MEGNQSILTAHRRLHICAPTVEERMKEGHVLETVGVAGDMPAETSSARLEAGEVSEPVLMTEEQLRAVTVGELTPLSGPIELVAYDPAWPQLFEREAERVRRALGDRVLLLEHVGSTSVPGLVAKPWIDMVLVVTDSADEPAYVPALEAAGYALRIREPDWYEHRMFKRLDPGVHLHVFSADCAEVERMLLFRDRLRSNDPDRRLYERTKRDLAQREWVYTQNYADAKATVVQEILTRAQRSEGSDPEEDGQGAPTHSP
jgi:GrpB-like predicted nucleotidyltransferase (UPF0157 family)